MYLYRYYEIPPHSVIVNGVGHCRRRHRRLPKNAHPDGPFPIRRRCILFFVFLRRSKSPTFHFAEFFVLIRIINRIG